MQHSKGCCCMLHIFAGNWNTCERSVFTTILRVDSFHREIIIGFVTTIDNAIETSGARCCVRPNQEKFYFIHFFLSPIMKFSLSRWMTFHRIIGIMYHSHTIKLDNQPVSQSNDSREFHMATGVRRLCCCDMFLRIYFPRSRKVVLVDLLTRWHSVWLERHNRRFGSALRALSRWLYFRWVTVKNVKEIVIAIQLGLGGGLRWQLNWKLFSSKTLTHTRALEEISKIFHSKNFTAAAACQTLETVDRFE